VPRPFVVVPYYNCEDLLARCLRSLERQNVSATVVLVDDASAAPARELGRTWCEAGAERVYLSREHNQGPAAARHDGLRWVLEHASSDSDVVVLLDGDDELANEHALETILSAYARAPAVRMTLGGHRRQSGQPVYRRRYQRWQLDYGLTASAPWRARHPRTFQVGLLRQAWPSIRWCWPNGAWIRSGTDVLLLLPMLGLLRWPELAQLEDILYIYNDVRPDGTTIEGSPRGRLRQLGTEAFVRRSVAWSLLVLPRLAVSAAHRRLRARAGTPPFRTGQPR
jgi:glycosyltransferase involved in cell wall biosynthesis